MSSTRVLRSLVAFIAAIVTVCSYSAASFAQSADQSQDAKIRVLQERIDALSKELKGIQEEQTKSSNTFIKGFFGTMDVSIDETTKGMSSMVAYHWGTNDPLGGPPYINNGAKSPPGPFGRVGWLPMMASNGSNIGYRGSHKIGKSDIDFIYQVSTAMDMSAAPGLQNTWTKSSNTVQGAIGLGDTWVGLRSKAWGTLKFGEMFTPYKTSTDR